MKKTLLATAIILALAATPTVFAKGKPTVEVGNNLSFATKFVGTAGAPATRLPCNDAIPTFPYGPQCADFPGWWCQKTDALWQAVCGPGALGTPVTATWGANLLPGAMLKAGRPIRVEMTLTETGVAANGYIVSNLTPDLEDRFATYATQGFEASANYVVYDSGATLKIERCADLACTVVTWTVLAESAISAELNSMGKVVYGYNWGTSGKTTAPTAGIYKLTFTANATVISDAGLAYQCAAEDNCTYVIINVLPAGKPSNPGGEH